MTQTIKNSGGNRALVCYLCGSDADTNVFNESVLGVFNNAGINVLSTDGVVDAIEPTRTVTINLSSGAWSRSLKIGNCDGALIVGVYFYTAPQPPEPAPEPDPDADPDDAEKWRDYMSAYQSINQDEEPEPPSITSLVCAALQEAFPDGKIGASSFVINPETTDFELDVE